MTDTAPAPRRWRDAQGEHIDVRGLPRPQPLVEVLRLLHDWPHDGGAVFGHFDRDPLGLYPELAEIGWAATPLPCDGGSALLRLQRLPPP
jgi:hypothetical protein